MRGRDTENLNSRGRHMERERRNAEKGKKRGRDGWNW